MASGGDGYFRGTRFMIKIKGQKIGFIGGGNMGEALMAGLLQTRTFSPRSIHVFDLRRPRLSFLKDRYKILPALSIKHLLQKTTILILAVKPQDIKGVLTALRPLLRPHHLVISIAAGIDTAFFSKHLGGGVKIARTMPNTPALVGRGVTGFYTSKTLTKKDQKVVQKIFSAVGRVISVNKESSLDTLTALSGSGPAFVYFFMESLILAGQKLGLNKTTTHDVVVETFDGALRLLKHTHIAPSDLRTRVTSKGGTTEAGLQQMKKDRIQQGLIHMIQAATRRATLLRKRAS